MEHRTVKPAWWISQKARAIGYRAAATLKGIDAPKTLIVHAGHHKVGTLWFQRILRTMCNRFGWRYFTGDQAHLPASAHVFHQNHSRLDFDGLPPYVGSHLIRDPRDIVISGYFYHLGCGESWCVTPRSKFDGKSYQDVLRSLGQEAGIEFEMRHSARNTFRAMTKWNFTNENMIEIRYEDLVEDEQEVFRGIFRHYGLTTDQIRKSLEIVQSFSFENVTKRYVGQAKAGAHLRSGKVGQWRDHFTDRHIDLCKDLYGNGLIQLGYEMDDKWS